MTSHAVFMQAAIQLAIDNVNQNKGGPFGAVIVKAGTIVARGNNQVTERHDPTCHAEMVAIRAACQSLGHFHLHGCTLYTSCEPCPMCLGAVYWAQLDAVYYAANHQQAAAAGFSDAFIYQQIQLPYTQRRIPFTHLAHADTLAAFQAWQQNQNKMGY